MATFKAIVFSQENHIKNDGTANIKIRLYHNESSQYISTKHYIFPNHMLVSGEISELDNDYQSLNYDITETIQGYRKQIMKLGSDRTSKMSCKELKDFLVKSSASDYEFIDFVEFSRSVISKTKKFKTASWYENAISSLCWYFGKEKIDIKEITSTNLNLYVKKLYEAGPNKRPLEPGAVGNYLEAIRSLFNKCKLEYNNDDIDLIRIPHNPFLKVKVPKYKRKRKNIGVDEIKKIRDSVFKTERENIGRDVWLMQFYLMGININDLYQLPDPIGGRINYERSKTNTDDNIHNFVLSIKIEPELKRLIDKYSSHGFLSDLRARYCNSYNLMKSVNKGMKLISEDFGFQKVTTNWARHTWASLARNKCEVNKADVDFCLGHVNHEYKMADIYIEIDYSIYDRINRKVLNLLIDSVPEEKNPINKKVEGKRLKNTYLRVV